MDHAGINHPAVFAAAVAAWLWGAGWYRVFARPWSKAARIDPAATMKAAPFILGFVADLVIAYVLAGAIGHLGTGQVTLWNGIVSAAILWAGFIATVLAVNHRYQGFGWDLTAIDAGHWLGVMIIAGAIIGWSGN